MATLPTKLTRDSIGIDTFERGLVWAVLLLRQAYNNGANDQAIRNYFVLKQQSKIERIEIGSRFNYLGLININATMPYFESVFELGGDLLAGLQELVTTSPTYSGNNLVASEIAIAPIADDDIRVTTLEQYFLWSVMEYHKALTDPRPTDNSRLNYVTLQVNYQGTTDPPTVSIKCTVEYDYPTWLESKNLVGAIGVNFEEVIGSGLIGSGILIGNEQPIISGANL